MELQVLRREHQLGEDFGVLRIDLSRFALNAVHPEAEIGERTEKGSQPDEA